MKTDHIFSAVGTLLTILGWFAAFWFGLKQQKVNTKESAKLRVYEDFWKQRGSLHESGSTLSTLILTGVPFILMEMDENMMIFPSPSKPLFLTAGQQTAIDRYTKFLGELQNAHRDFQGRFMDFWRSLEMWINLMPKLEPAKKVLTSEYAVVQERLNQLISYHVSLSRMEWKNWDRRNLKERHEQVWSDFGNLMAYTEDMMGLVHNELVSPIFGYEKAQRKPQDPTFKVLTKDGLAVIKTE